MPKATNLSKLNLTETPIRSSLSPTLHKRSNLLKKLNEQREMARCMLENEIFTAYKHKWITNAETGAKERQQLPKRVLPWYYNNNNFWLIDLKYGNRRLSITDGKSTIEVGNQEQLLNTFDILIEAANAGELDEQLATFKKKSKKA